MKNLKNLLLITLFTLVSTIGFSQTISDSVNLRIGGTILHTFIITDTLELDSVSIELIEMVNLNPLTLVIKLESATILNRNFKPLGTMTWDTVLISVNSGDKLEFDVTSTETNTGVKVRVTYHYSAITGILTPNKSKLDLNVNVFPNPTTEYLNLNSDNDLYNSTYTVYSLNGQTVKQGTLGDNRLYVGDLPQGMYFIKLDVDGSEVVKEFEVR